MSHATHVSPILKPLEPVSAFGRRRWLVVRDWRYELPGGTVALIPRGFVFDGASVPRLLTPLVSPTGVLFIASIIHDYGYRFDCLPIEQDGTVIIAFEGAGRKFWDDLLHTVAEQHSRLPGFSRTVWSALRLFGGAAWRRRREPMPEAFFEHADAEA